MLPTIDKTAINKIKDVITNELFPVQLKYAKLVLIPKLGNGIEKYRLLSLISVFGKVLETTVANRLRRQTEDGLHPLQYGFRLRRSTVEAMTEVMRIAGDAVNRAEAVL